MIRAIINKVIDTTSHVGEYFISCAISKYQKNINMTKKTLHVIQETASESLLQLAATVSRVRDYCMSMSFICCSANNCKKNINTIKKTPHAIQETASVSLPRLANAETRKVVCTEFVHGLIRDATVIALAKKKEQLIAKNQKMVCTEFVHGFIRDATISASKPMMALPLPLASTRRAAPRIASALNPLAKGFSPAGFTPDLAPDNIRTTPLQPQLPPNDDYYPTPYCNEGYYEQPSHVEYYGQSYAEYYKHHAVGEYYEGQPKVIKTSPLNIVTPLLEQPLPLEQPKKNHRLPPLTSSSQVIRIQLKFSKKNVNDKRDFRPNGCPIQAQIAAAYA